MFKVAAPVTGRDCCDFCQVSWGSAPDLGENRVGFWTVFGGAITSFLLAWMMLRSCPQLSNIFDATV